MMHAIVSEFFTKHKRGPYRDTKRSSSINKKMARPSTSKTRQVSEETSLTLVPTATAHPPSNILYKDWAQVPAEPPATSTLIIEEPEQR